MMYIIELFIATITLVNLGAFFIMFRDKRTSSRAGHQERTPEGLIFFLATVGGSVGVYAGMLVFRHKTKRWYFQLGIPLLVIQNATTMYLLLALLEQYI